MTYKKIAFCFLMILSFNFSFAGNEKIQSADQIDSDMNVFNKLHKLLLNNGIYIGPSGYEVGFISNAHTKEVLDKAIELFCKAMDEVY